MQILVVDDHRLFVSGLQFLLSDLNENVRLIEANSVEAVSACGETSFDLVLLDLKLPGHSGLSALEQVRERLDSPTIVILSSEEDPTMIRLCIEQGAAGFIPKSSSPDVLIHALKLILAGGIYLPKQVLGAPPCPRLEATSGNQPNRDSRPRPSAEDRARALMSPRQHAALMLAVKGKSNKVIARELGIAEGTVKLHLSAAFRLLGVSNRTEAVFAVARRDPIASMP